MSKENIMHIDMDAFFAAVEKLDNPELEEKPVIVGGVFLNDRGVVSTACYIARKYGVHSAMPIFKAKKLCPDGIYLSGRMERYKELSIMIEKIFYKYTPLVEKISIDEAFLDLTGCHKLFGTSREIGLEIKNDIKEKTGLIASVGISKNKYLAKLASAYDKPDGFKIIRADEVDQFLDILPIGKLWGVGEKTEEKLKEHGIDLVGNLKKIPKKELHDQFGKLGIKLYNLARGIDKREVIPDEEIKSLSQEETFSRNLTDNIEIFSVLMGMAEKVSKRLHDHKLWGKTIFIKVRYANFKTYTRRITLNRYIHSTEKIYHMAKKLLKTNNLLVKPLRLLGIGVSNLRSEEQTQLSLFGRDLQDEQLDKTINAIKNKYGDKSVRRGIDLIYTREDDLNKEKN